MKKLLLLVTLGLCFTTVKAQDFATQAEPLYRSGQYAQALLNYEQALKNSQTTLIFTTI